MIDKDFWKKVAENWAIEDNIVIPVIDDPPPILDEGSLDDEIESILSELDLDDL